LTDVLYWLRTVPYQKISCEVQLGAALQAKPEGLLVSPHEKNENRNS
jgi:hypothetical protein